MKNIGSVVGLYPAPDTVVGTVQNGKINWMNVAHVGVWGFDCIMLSIGKPHYTARALRVGANLSVNLVDEAMLVRADYVGLVSGENTDKSDVFPVFRGQLPDAPMIENAPVAMECVIEEIHETKTHLKRSRRPRLSTTSQRPLRNPPACPPSSLPSCSTNSPRKTLASAARPLKK